MQAKKRLIGSVTVLILVGFLITNMASFFVSRSALREKIEASELPLTSDNIYTEIQQDILKPVFISSLMASDTFLRDWVLGGEKDEQQIRKFLKEIHEKYNTIASFFVSDKTNRYYHFSGQLKTVHPDSLRDQWYFRNKHLSQDYETNVDVDMANDDQTTIFVNHKVFDYDENYIGATGIGLGLTTMQDLIMEYQSKYQRKIYFINEVGDVVLHNFGPSTSDLNIAKMEGLAELSETILAQNEAVFSFHRAGKMIHLKTRFIPELKWMLMVEQEEEKSLKAIFNAFKLNFLILFLVGGIIVLLINFTINTYRKQLDILSEADRKLRRINAESESLRELLLDIVTHDLRNPASTIYSMSELALSKFPDDESLELIHLGSKQLLDVLTNTTILSRAAFGEKIPKENLSLLEELESLRVEFASYLDEVNVSLSIDIPENLIIYANPLIGEVFKNYVSNALKYAADGGSIEITAIAEHDSVLVSVNDLGTTIPEQDRVRIFDRMAQIEGEHKTGRGLGLAIVKRLAVAHGGSAWVEPNSPKGNRFCLRIPARGAER